MFFYLQLCLSLLAFGGSQATAINAGYGIPVAPPINAGYGIPVAPPINAGHGIPVAPPLNAGYGIPVAPPINAGHGIPVAPPISVVPFQPFEDNTPPLEVVSIPTSPFVIPPTSIDSRFFQPAGPFRFAAAPGNFAAAPRHFAPFPVARAAFPVAHGPVPVAAPFVRAAFPVAHGPVPVAAPLVRAALPFAPVSDVPLVQSSQFHAQDEAGGFSYGYENVNSAKHEVHTPDGVTRGSYSYVDANGIHQHVEYTADPIHGFQVRASNLPGGPGVVVAQDPAVVAATADFHAAFNAVLARDGHAIVKREAQPIDAGYGIPVAAPLVTVTQRATPHIVLAPRVRAVPIAHAAPLLRFAPQPFAAHPVPVTHAASLLRFAPQPFAVRPVPQALPQLRLLNPVTPAFAEAPVVAVEPLVPVETSSQFHAQDEAGGFSFGYTNPLSSRQETRSADGVTRGSYSYVDANGIAQLVEYTADAIHGFQVRATNLPIAPAA
jgi:hypothetical protein